MTAGWQVAVAVVASASLVGNGVALAGWYRRWSYRRNNPKRFDGRKAGSGRR